MTSEHRLAKGLLLVACLMAMLFAAYRAGHSTGVRVAVAVVEALVFIGVRSAIGSEETQYGHEQMPDPNADFSRYRSLVSGMRFAANSRADFDRGASPLLLRLYTQVLAEEHDVRIVADRDRARELMGPAWSLVEGDGRISRKALEDMVSRLEELSS